MISSPAISPHLTTAIQMTEMSITNPISSQLPAQRTISLNIQPANPTNIGSTMCIAKSPKYQCTYCPYHTDKKSSFIDHQGEFCDDLIKIAKDMECPVCGKSFTYRGLRLHLNYYTKGKHVANDGHGNFSPGDHQVLLETLKKSKK